MRNRLLAYLVVAILCSFTGAFAPQANAAYPDKPIEFVTHGGAGGGSDIFIRTMGAILEKEGIVKQKIRVVNRTGGSGTACMDYFASKKGDPYVLGVISGSPLNTMIRKVSVMRYEDLTLIAGMILDSNLIFARYNAPYNDMKGLMAESKKTGKEMNVAVGSLGGLDQISAYRAGKAIGVPFNIISFKSSAGSATALLGGHADLRVGDHTEMLDPKAKQVKILGVMSEKRHPLFPDVLTLKEQGFNVTGVQLRGFWAPQAFPPQALKYWEDALGKVVKTKMFKDYNDVSFGTPIFMTGKELRNYTDVIVADMTRDLKALGLFEEKK